MAVRGLAAAQSRGCGVVFAPTPRDPGTSRPHNLNMRDRIRNDATVWVSWPKKASKVPTDITEDVIRDIALSLGFVDVKVCAVDEVWSGLKLVIRRELRHPPR